MSVKDNMIQKMKDKRDAIRSCQDKDELKTLKGEFDELLEAVEQERAIEEAEARRDHLAETEDRELWREFGRYLNGEKISDRAREALAIRDPGMENAAGRNAVRAPGNAFLYARDSDEARRAALGEVTSDWSNLQPPTPKTAPYMLGLPPTPVFDRATKLPAVNGVAIPVVDQTLADPFAGVSVTKGTSEGDEKGSTNFNDALEEISTQEYNATVIISDLAIRRIPQLESTVQSLFLGALAFDVDGDLVTAAHADGLTTAARATTGDIERSDLIDLETNIPWYWRTDRLEYGMSETALASIKKQEATNGMPIFAADASQGAYDKLNGYGWFLDDFPGVTDHYSLMLHRWDAMFVGVGQDIAFRRSNEGESMVKHNSTIFSVWAHMGIGRPIPELAQGLRNEQ